METLKIVNAMFELIKENDKRNTKEILKTLKDVPETPEIKELLIRLQKSDRIINKQCEAVLKATKQLMKNS